MSLLDKGTEEVILYPEETITDPDGNTLTRPSRSGIPARATIQPVGTGAPDDMNGEGYVSGPQRYRLRLPRATNVVLGAQSAVEWRGQRWAVVGEPTIFTGSRKTSHAWYVIER